MTNAPGSPDRWAEVEELFARALELAADSRERFLAAIPDGDLREEVRSLVAHQSPDGNFIEGANVIVQSRFAVDAVTRRCRGRDRPVSQDDRRGAAARRG
jgi:hypothetical protein